MKPEERMEVVSIRLTSQQKKKLEFLGGSKWVRAQLELTNFNLSPGSDRSIFEIGLPRRVAMTLISVGISRVHDMRFMSKDELLRSTPGFGKAAMNELLARLKEKGFDDFFTE